MSPEHRHRARRPITTPVEPSSGIPAGVQLQVPTGVGQFWAFSHKMRAPAFARARKLHREACGVSRSKDHCEPRSMSSRHIRCRPLEELVLRARNAFRGRVSLLFSGHRRPRASRPCLRSDARGRRRAPVAHGHRKLGADKTVSCEVLNLDRYQRLIAICAVDGHDIAEAMLTMG